MHTYVLPVVQGPAIDVRLSASPTGRWFAHGDGLLVDFCSSDFEIYLRFAHPFAIYQLGFDLLRSL